MCLYEVDWFVFVLTKQQKYKKMRYNDNVGVASVISISTEGAISRILSNPQASPCACESGYHLSWVWCYHIRMQPTRAGVSVCLLRASNSRALPLFGLALHGVCHASCRCRRSGGLLPHHFTLTTVAGGGIFLLHFPSACLQSVHGPLQAYCPAVSRRVAL